MQRPGRPFSKIFFLEIMYVKGHLSNNYERDHYNAYAWLVGLLSSAPINGKCLLHELEYNAHMLSFFCLFEIFFIFPESNFMHRPK